MHFKGEQKLTRSNPEDMTTRWTSLLAVGLLAVVEVVRAEPPPEFMKIVFECQKLHPITQEEMEALKVVNVPESKSGKCFVDCLFEMMGVQSYYKDTKNLEEGKFSLEKAKELAEKKMSEQPEELEKHLQLMGKCNSEVEPHSNSGEGCTIGAKLMECIKTYAPEFGIMLPGSD